MALPHQTTDRAIPLTKGPRRLQITRAGKQICGVSKKRALQFPRDPAGSAAGARKCEIGSAWHDPSEQCQADLGEPYRTRPCVTRRLRQAGRGL